MRVLGAKNRLEGILDMAQPGRLACASRLPDEVAELLRGVRMPAGSPRFVSTAALYVTGYYRQV